LLYKLTASLIRAYANLANELAQAGYTPDEIEQLAQEVDYYEKVRTEVKLASGDYIDLKMYEPAMRHLIDAYIRAEDSVKVSAFDDISLVQLIVECGVGAIDQLPEGIRTSPGATAETIENNVRKVIIDEQPLNPIYYERMSVLLDAIIQARKTQAIDYQQYLEKIVELARQVQNPARGMAYPTMLDTTARRALYDNLDNDEALAVALDDEIRSTKKDSWRGNKAKEKEVRYAIRKHVKDDTTAERIMELVRHQIDY
jgi:type I restriction enzyme R subunit